MLVRGGRSTLRVGGPRLEEERTPAVTRAHIVCDSVGPDGVRLTTMEVVLHRFVLSEFNTHRQFSRNSASSRAIPAERQLAAFADHPAFPVEWPAERAGMQGGGALADEDLADARALFEDVHAYTVVRVASYLEDHPDKERRLHKSLVNRLLEWAQFHTVVVSATDWQGFWEQRCSPLAQPEIRVAAEAMRAAYDASTPVELDADGWHTPYVRPDEVDLPLETRKRISAARCARVSYLTHDGRRDLSADEQLYERLVTADPPHWSPLEHVARPLAHGEDPAGNFRGWRQLRHDVEWARGRP
jgi:hypothetical protein